MAYDDPHGFRPLVSPSKDAEVPSSVPTPRPQGLIAAVVRVKEHSRIIQRTMLALPRWVTPNGVTIFRGLLTVPLVWMVLSSMYLHALALFALIMVLDFVDGALAHARNMNSVSGAFLDPLADKIAVCGVLIAVADRLPYMAAPATACVLVAAVFLTLIRIPRLRNGGGSSGVAALNVGKLKLLAETVAISTVLLALATGSAALMTAFLWSIWAAAFLGMASFMGQIAR